MGLVNGSPAGGEGAVDTYSVGPRGSSLRSPSSFAHPFLLRGVMAPPAAPPGSALSVVGFHKLLVSLSIVALFTHFELPSLSWQDLEYTHTHIYIHTHAYLYTEDSRRYSPSSGGQKASIELRPNTVVSYV